MKEKKNNFPYKNAGIASAYVFDIIADSENDMPSDSTHPEPNGNYDTKHWSPGSTCLVTNTGNIYKLNTKKEWVFWAEERIGFIPQIVEQLPEQGETEVLYLVPKTNEEELNYYDEYLWINNSFEKIGNTQINVPNYTINISETSFPPNSALFNLYKDNETNNSIYIVGENGIKCHKEDNSVLTISQDNKFQPVETLIGTYSNSSNTYNLYRKVFTTTLTKSSLSGTEDPNTHRLYYYFGQSNSSPVTNNDITENNIKHTIKLSCNLVTEAIGGLYYLEEAEKIIYRTDNPRPFRLMLPEGSDIYLQNYNGTITATLTIEYYA